MSIPPYPDYLSTPDGGPTGPRPPIKYVWPKRIAVILAGLALLGGIGFGAKTLLDKDDSTTTSQETVQSESPSPGPSQAPQSPMPGASQAPTGQTGPTDQTDQTGQTAPMRLDRAVTDSAGALSSEQMAEVKTAVKSLQAARNVRMWVVYVDAFDAPPLEWARKTRSLTKMGERDAIFAVATKQRQYAFLVSPGAANGAEQAINDMRRDNVEPKLRDGDFAGAAVAAATGLQALG